MPDKEQDKVVQELKNVSEAEKLKRKEVLLNARGKQMEQLQKVSEETFECIRKNRTMLEMIENELNEKQKLLEEYEKRLEQWEKDLDSREKELNEKEKVNF